VWADERSAPEASDLPISPARSGDHAAESGLVCRHHLSADAARLRVSGRCHGLGIEESAGLAADEHRRCGVLRLGLKEAQARFGKPEIFNTDQGSQFTSTDFTGVLRDAEVRISMDGRGRWMDNVFIERLWRSLKFKCVYLNAFETGSELRTGLGRWITYYNGQRPHSRPAGRTPDEVYGRGSATPYRCHATDMAFTRMAA
jgi:transposase InsO family protein